MSLPVSTLWLCLVFVLLSAGGVGTKQNFRNAAKHFHMAAQLFGELRTYIRTCP